MILTPRNLIREMGKWGNGEMGKWGNREIRG
jgi:hypothetical protein